MNIKWHLVWIASIALHTNAVAADANTLFHCKITNGKQVKVTKEGNRYRYAFGHNLAKPELTLTKALSEVMVKRNKFEDGSALVINIPNHAYTYSVFSVRTSRSRNDYLIVQKGKEAIAEMQCQAGSVYLGM